MKFPISLRARILTMLFCLVVITMLGGLVSIWHSTKMEGYVSYLIEEQIPAFQTAQELKQALVMQKGYISYYFQDPDPGWLEMLETADTEFKRIIEKAGSEGSYSAESKILKAIASKYKGLSEKRDRIIELYSSGRAEEGFKLHTQARIEFFDIIELCDEFTEATLKRISSAKVRSRDEANLIHRFALITLTVVILLGILLAYTLTKDVLDPIHKLAYTSESSMGPMDQADEVKTLSYRFMETLKDLDQTRTKLEWSREHLLQAEKWAMIGKLAAGVAHSVRNPLTSVKMRLYSMEISLKPSGSEREDIDVITEEIARIENIVSNFLEFSRPPKLKPRKCSTEDFVDAAAQLLRHRLESQGVTLKIKRQNNKHSLMADPDQLKEVFLNLLVNACDAMPDGGKIFIDEELVNPGETGPKILIRIRDTGPGVSDSIRNDVFKPFISDKREGTGLGLSIAQRLVEEHGGRLQLEPECREGALFTIMLPVKED